jgi:hypothetical protein
MARAEEAPVGRRHRGRDPGQGSVGVSPTKRRTVEGIAPPLREMDALFRKSGKAIIGVTVREILDEELAKKLP